MVTIRFRCLGKRPRPSSGRDAKFPLQSELLLRNLEIKMFHHNSGGVKPASKGGSAKTFLNVGSGSRPTKSKHGIHSSAPMEPHKLHRKPKSPMK